MRPLGLILFLIILLMPPLASGYVNLGEVFTLKPEAIAKAIGGVLQYWVDLIMGIAKEVRAVATK